MRTLQEAWRYHGVDDDQPVPEFFQYGWEASEEAHADEIASIQAEVKTWQTQSERLYTFTMRDQAEIAALRATVAGLEKECAALQRDAERLDWCEKHLVEVGQDMSEQFRVVFLDENERDQRSARFPSLRQAIDAALASTKEQHD